jgi:hypothetical protein
MRARLWLLLSGLPTGLVAQGLPPAARSPLRPAVPAAGRITPAPGGGAARYSQFDTLGVAPLGAPGDSVTLYLFTDGQHLDRVVPARITARQRMMPPRSWRDQCDAVAHPGWNYRLDPAPSAPYGVIVPGVLPPPATEPAPPLARSGARQLFTAFANRVWQMYRAIMAPPSDRAEAGLWWDFFGDAGDAGWGGLRLFGVRLPGRRSGAAFSFWMHDDRSDPADNTTGTWIVDGWGLPVAEAVGNLDIYGTVDRNRDGVDEIVTAAGLIEFRDGAWQFPPSYSEEPCLARRMGLGG